LREKRFQEAEAVVAGLPGRLRGAALLLATGRCRELMGQAKPAEDAYRAAVEAGPTNFEAVREWAEYQSRAGRPVEAVPALRRLLAADPKPDVVPAARRLLALALATSPKPDDFREAVAAADRNLADGGNAPEDLLVKARVLATRLYLRRDAVRLAREADARQPLTDPADQFFLAQLLADTGAWPEGRRRLVDLLSRTGPDPARLRFLADRLLRNKQADEAGVWLDRLEAVAAADPGTARLRAAWHAARGNPEAAAARLVEAAGDGTTAADRDRCRALAAAAADLAREFDPTRATLGAAAEALYRRAAAGGDPADVSALAVCLAANGKLGEALDRCRAVPPLDAAVALVGIAYAPAALTDDDLAAVERAVAGVLPQVPQAVRDQIDGAVHARRGRYREAAEAFGRAAAGGDPAMLNNAAYMRVLAGGPAEAEPLAERAIAAVGPTASLLDTRGTARLATGRAAEAVADLEAAVDQEPTAARWLHLAAAYKAAGRTEDARKAVGKADKSRHDGSLLVPAEGRAYQRLAEELRPGKGSRL
jgi:tetratricopeptide (TPR) repeat protein